jgi:peroxiredoxin
MSLLGQPAPDFTLPNSKKEPVALASFRGKSLVIAFYPAAFTGVCEKEMCTFRDNLGSLNEAGGDVVGISVDMPFSNGAFAAKNGVTFPLLSDVHRSAVRAYGVSWNNFAGIAGLEVANRAVFVIDAAGNVAYEWIAPNPGVEPDYEAVKAAVRAAQA